MKIDKKTFPYTILVLALGAFVFYIIPLIFKGSSVLNMGLLFFVNSIYCIISNMLYTVKFGMQVTLPITLALLSLPSLLFLFGAEYYYYALFYAAAALVGCCIGFQIYKRYL